MAAAYVFFTEEKGMKYYEMVRYVIELHKSY